MIKNLPVTVERHTPNSPYLVVDAQGAAICAMIGGIPAEEEKARADFIARSVNAYSYGSIETSGNMP